MGRGQCGSQGRRHPSSVFSLSKGTVERPGFGFGKLGAQGTEGVGRGEAGRVAIEGSFPLIPGMTGEHGKVLSVRII